MELPNEIKTAFTLLSASGYKSFLVGGAVRDFLLDKIPNDFDMTTDALPGQILNVFKDYKTFNIGEKYGTICVLIGKFKIEITTFRTDGQYNDFRHPNEVMFANNLEQDLSRRDFTINALALDCEFNLVDLFGGKNDLQNKIICTVGNPKQRFNEDALRILRAIRFSSTLGFEIEKNTKSAIFECKDLLKNVSVERLFEELCKLILGKNVENILIEYIEVLGVFMPELLPMKNFEQHSGWHNFDVLTHTAVATSFINGGIVNKLTMLFHDSGKPSTFILDQNGIGHFPEHPKVGSEIANKILIRLKAPKKIREQVVLLIKYHDNYLEPDKQKIKIAISKYGKSLFDKLVQVQEADTFARFKNVDDLKKFKQIKLIENELKISKQCFSLEQLAIDGNDILSMGYKGKIVGIILASCLQTVLNNKVENDKNCLKNYIKSQKNAKKW